MITVQQLLTNWRAAIKARKATADDNIERSEPETFLMNAQDYVFGIIMSALWMMIAYAIMTDQLTQWIANIMTTISGTFEERLAILTAIFVLFSDALVVIGIAINREPSNGDVVDVVNDIGEQIDERFAELENRVDERLARIEGETFDLTDKQLNERISL